MPARPLFGRVLAASGSVAEHEYPAGLVAAPHFHDRSYLTILLAGAATERFCGRTELLAAPTVHLMTAGERHSNSYDAATRCLHIEVDAGTLAPGPFRDPRASLLGGLIADEFHRGDELSPVAIEGLLLALLARGSRSSTSTPPWLPRVTNTLRDTFASPVSLEQLAAIAGVHRAHLCREFHRRTGRTIGAYVRELRVNRACMLLASSSATLAEIALECGFADQSHFATTFRRMLRVTPGQYRRMSRH